MQIGEFSALALAKPRKRSMGPCSTQKAWGGVQILGHRRRDETRTGTHTPVLLATDVADCGAGVGRITKGFLLKVFNQVSGEQGRREEKGSLVSWQGLMKSLLWPPSMASLRHTTDTALCVQLVCVQYCTLRDCGTPCCSATPEPSAHTCGVPVGCQCSWR